jgi:hypothetical protein
MLKMQPQASYLPRFQPHAVCSLLYMLHTASAPEQGLFGMKQNLKYVPTLSTTPKLVFP